MKYSCVERVYLDKRKREEDMRVCGIGWGGWTVPLKPENLKEKIRSTLAGIYAQAIVQKNLKRKEGECGEQIASDKYTHAAATYAKMLC